MKITRLNPGFCDDDCAECEVLRKGGDADG